MSSMPVQFYATGRRKTATARVFLRPGSGRFQVNGRTYQQYFERETSQVLVARPLAMTEHLQDFDVYATVRGGGKSGQAGAILHALSRALTIADPNLRSPLKKAGFLTRDARAVERKKYGRPGARKRFQYSKR